MHVTLQAEGPVQPSPRLNCRVVQLTPQWSSSGIQPSPRLDCQVVQLTPQLEFKPNPQLSSPAARDFVQQNLRAPALLMAALTIAAMSVVLTRRAAGSSKAGKCLRSS